MFRYIVASIAVLFPVAIKADEESSLFTC